MPLLFALCLSTSTTPTDSPSHYLKPSVKVFNNSHWIDEGLELKVMGASPGHYMELHLEFLFLLKPLLCWPFSIFWLVCNTFANSTINNLLDVVFCTCHTSMCQVPRRSTTTANAMRVFTFLGWYIKLKPPRAMLYFHLS